MVDTLLLQQFSKNLVRGVAGKYQASQLYQVLSAGGTFGAGFKFLFVCLFKQGCP